MTSRVDRVMTSRVDKLMTLRVDTKVSIAQGDCPVPHDIALTSTQTLDSMACASRLDFYLIYPWMCACQSQTFNTDLQNGG